MFLFCAQKHSLWYSLESPSRGGSNEYLNLCLEQKYEKYQSFLSENLQFLEVYITKTYLYNFDPLKPHFYVVKLGFTGVYIIFIISAQKHRLWVFVRTASSRWF